MPLMRLVFAFLIAIGSAEAAEPPSVLATIKPIHSLVAQVMGETGRPRLLIEGAASPHSFTLKPSTAGAVSEADLIVWVGPELETFLVRPLESLASEARVLTLIDAPGVTQLHVRGGDSHGHDESGRDPHVWLSPANARAIVGAVAITLAEIDPDRAETYAANALAASAEIDAVARAVEDAVRPVRDVRYFVFHDGYRYFEDAFGLRWAGAVTFAGEESAGLKRVTELRRQILTERIACVFTEPQFSPRLADRLTEGTPARRGTLDPLGATLEPGPGLYAELMIGLGRSFRQCLGGGK